MGWDRGTRQHLKTSHFPRWKCAAIIVQENVMKTKPKYFQIIAQPRYWEDTEVNGTQDFDGDLIPFGDGRIWEPVIDLDAGSIVDWPENTTAKIHYKVCDEGD
jgi:hypothetical protein